MQRYRASRPASWLLVAALLLKSAVPMLASAAAGLQGKATAEVCDVYGVDTSMFAARSHAPVAEQDDRGRHADHAGHAHHGHPGHHVEGSAATATTTADRAPLHGPSRVAHGGDHCALSALAFALGSDASAVAASPAAVAPMPAAGATTPLVVDPAARWAAQLQHAPPASS